MKSFACNQPMRNDIKKARNRKVPMKNKGWITGVLIAAFAAVNDNALAQDNVKVVGEPASRNISNTQVTIIEDHAGIARNYSARHDRLVIALLQGNMNEKYTAMQYAQMLGRMFKDPKRTDYPTEVAFYVEVDEGYMGNESELPTSAIVYINGYSEDWVGGRMEDGTGGLEDGDNFIHPVELVSKIRYLTEKYARKNGLTSIHQQSESNPSLAHSGN